MTNQAILKTPELEAPKLVLKHAITDLFEVLTNEINAVMDDIGENKDEYHLNIHPFSIERLDKKPVPAKLLIAIQSKLQSNQSL